MAYDHRSERKQERRDCKAIGEGRPRISAEEWYGTDQNQTNSRPETFCQSIHRFLPGCNQNSISFPQDTGVDAVLLLLPELVSTVVPVTVALLVMVDRAGAVTLSVSNSIQVRPNERLGI